MDNGKNDRLSLGDRWLASVRDMPPRALRFGGAALLVAVLGLGALATRYGDTGPAGAEPEVVEAAAASALTEAAARLAGEGPRVPGEPGRFGAAAGAAGVGADEDAEDAAPAAIERTIEWASPREPSPVAPVPAEERVPKPAAVRGIYIGAWSAGSPARLEQLIRLADETEINAFVIDIKDVTGEVSYGTRVPLAQQVGADRRLKIGDMRGMLERLRERGIYPIARIVAFKDPLLADARPEWAIQRRDGGGAWEDNKGVRWVDSFNRDVWDYNIELAREAIALGFSEIQWDYVRFPDVPSSYMETAVYTARDGRTMVDGIRAFLIRSQERLAELDVPITADVFGITTSIRHDVGIGQVWEKMADVADVLLPMVYPSHYPRGTWGYDRPNAAPYQIVRRAMEDGVARSKSIEGAATIRPWLQAFTMGEPAYGPEHIRAQIDAVYDAGLTEWILWDPAVRYPAEAFVSADGEEPWFAGSGERLYRPEVDGEPLGQPIRP